MPSEILKVVFQANQSDIDKFNQSLKDADSASKDLDKNLDELGKNEGPKKASDGIDTLVKGVKAFLAFELVRELGRIATEASKVAAAGEGIRSAFSNLGGTRDDLRRLSDAVGGTVDNLKLMSFAVKALQRGLDMKQITLVLEALDKQADATGGSFEALSDKFIKTLKSAKDVPALLEDITNKAEGLGTVAAETGDSYDRLAAAQANLEEAFGRLINSDSFRTVQAFFAETLDQITEFLEGKDFGVAGKSVDELNKELDITIKRLNEARSGRSFNEKLFGDSQDRKRLLDDLEAQQLAILKQIESAKDGRLAEIARLRNDKKEFAQSIKEQGDIAKQAISEQNAEALKKKQEANKKLLAEDKKRADQEVQDAIEVILRINEATEQTKKDLEKKKADQEVTDALNVITEIDKSKDKNAKDLASYIESAVVSADELAESGDDAADAFNRAAIAVFQMVDGLASLDKNAPVGKKIFGGLQAILGALSFINPAFGAAAAGVGTIGRIAFRNQGGWIDGDGPDRDSVIAMLTPGEHVTRRTSAQMSPLLLDAINAGEINDKDFKRLSNPAPIVYLNQDQVVAAIQNMPQVDLYKSGSALYEVKRKANENSVSRRRRLIP